MARTNTRTPATAGKAYWIVKAFPFPTPGGSNSWGGVEAKQALRRYVDQAAAAGLDGIDCNADSATVDAELCAYAHVTLLSNNTRSLSLGTHPFSPFISDASALSESRRREKMGTAN